MTPSHFSLLGTPRKVDRWCIEGMLFADPMPSYAEITSNWLRPSTTTAVMTRRDVGIHRTSRHHLFVCLETRYAHVLKRTLAGHICQCHCVTCGSANSVAPSLGNSLRQDACARPRHYPIGRRRSPTRVKSAQLTGIGFAERCRPSPPICREPCDTRFNCAASESQRSNQRSDVFIGGVALRDLHAQFSQGHVAVFAGRRRRSLRAQHVE
jgi:hypothetical protein